MPEARLIDRTAITEQLRAIEQNSKLNDAQKFRMAKFVVENAPTIEAEPVRHGRWIEHGGVVVATCSNCNASYIKDVLQSLSPYAEHLTRHCPNCGAKMDGGAENASA